jgi:hypothetical protein
MAKMKYLGKLAFGFVSGLLIAEILLAGVAEHLPDRSIWPTPQAEIKHQFAATGPQPSVLFFGSSITEAAIDPERLATAGGFNAAFPFASPLSSEVWYRHELRFSSETDVVVLGIAPWPADAYEKSEWLAPALDRSYAFEPYWLDKTNLHRNKGVLADWFDLRHFQLGLTANNWKENGHHFGYYGRQADRATIELSVFELSRLPENQEQAIRQINKLSVTNGTQLVLLIEPSGDEFMKRFRPERVSAFIESLEQLGEDLGIPVWDTFSIDWPEEMYADGVHFNREGTIAYSHQISTMLASLNQK